MGKVKWDLCKVKQEALKYKYRIDFKLGSKSAYNWASYRRLLDEVCQHMSKKKNLIYRDIYVYNFKDVSVYIGLTWDMETRHKNHLNSGPVHDYILAGNLDYKVTILEESVHMEQALIREQFWLDYYKNLGFNILNKNKKCSSLGSTRRRSYSLKSLKEIAKLYQTRHEWYKKDQNSYSYACRHNILDFVCGEHLKSRTWSYEELKLEALKYSSKVEFLRNNSGAAQAAALRGVYEEICSHMVPLRKKWTKDLLKQEAAKYKNTAEFKKNSPSAYHISFKYGLREICSHMTKLRENRRIIHLESEQVFDTLQQAALAVNRSVNFVYKRLKGLVKDNTGFTYIYCTEY